jgi:hypothetical protein
MANLGTGLAISQIITQNGALADKWRGTNWPTLTQIISKADAINAWLNGGIDALNLLIGSNYGMGGTTFPSIKRGVSGTGVDFGASKGNIVGSNFGSARDELTNLYNLLNGLPLDVPRTGWSPIFDDEDTVYDKLASYAFDGSDVTFWVTESINPPANPHYIGANMGYIFPIQGFKYKPRQDGNLHGNIVGYEFYTSNDGSSWTLQASGTFATDASEKTVTFTPVLCQYIKLKSTSTVLDNGGTTDGNWANCCNLSVQLT